MLHIFDVFIFFMIYYNGQDKSQRKTDIVRGRNLLFTLDKWKLEVYKTARLPAIPLVYIMFVSYLFWWNYLVSLLLYSSVFES